VWLRPDGQSETLFEHSPNLDVNDRSLTTWVFVRPGVAESLALGGPLECGVEADVQMLAGCVVLQFNPPRNKDGYGYALVPLDEAGKSNALPPPRCEIRDSQDSVVASGQFEDG
jgi:hypothetical protein